MNAVLGFVLLFLTILRTGVANTVDLGTYGLQRVGLVNENIRIAGTGSMYPTFPKGSGATDIARANEIVALSKMRRYPSGIVILSKRFGGYTLEHGDIISFQNEKTNDISKRHYGAEAGFVKRVIGLPGDRIEIRDGFVYRNGQRLKEPYTARARSTFGGTVTLDCKELVVSQGKLFVLGDNRTGSLDSRHELGLVDITDVDHVLPYSEQTPYESLWRDPSHDDALVTQPTLDVTVYLSLLNEKRKAAGVPKLKLDTRLQTSALKRGVVILRSNDFSPEGTQSGYPVRRAMSDAGYSNIVWGEAPATGYYTSEELIDNSFQFPDTKKFLLDRDFTDIGVAAYLGNLNGCPTQIVVQHFGGYVPPNYPKDMVASWQQALTNLQSIQPSWTALRDAHPFYENNKTAVDRINQLIDERISTIARLVTKMQHNEWLSAEDNQLMKDDDTLGQEQETLSKTLNSK